MVCADRNCCALAEPGSKLCTVHASITRRYPSDAPIHCYACGGLIRRDRRWLVRTEGAFHLRPACMNASPDAWKIQPGIDAAGCRVADDGLLATG